MPSETKSHLGKKILYALVIFLSCLIMLVSLAGIIGVWVIERPIAEAAVSVFKLVENTSVAVRQPIDRVDQTLTVLEAETTEIADASQQLSQNITDEGLVLVLLPEEKEQQLIETADSLRETFDAIRSSIATGLEFYRSISSIPFVNLPGLSEDQMDEIESSLGQTQELVTTLRSQIADFRAGVSDAIDKVETTANQLTEEIQGARQALAQVDSNLAELEALSIRLQEVIPGILVTVAVILTLLFVFVIFTQVEVILLYIARWRQLEQAREITAGKSPAPVAEEVEPGSEVD